jgi:adenine deaminase
MEAFDPERRPLEPTIDELEAAVAVAAGRAPADLLLAGGTLLNVFDGTVLPVDIAIAGRLIAAVLPAGMGGAAAVRWELRGAHLAPGLIDGHMHVESSWLTPPGYARLALPRGVVGVVCDPHEIANVAGLPGVRWWLDFAPDLPFDLWATAPSCVPSTLLEGAGAELGVGEIDELLAHPRVVGVAELMSFPGVIAGEAAQLAKVAIADHAGVVTEGHAPGLVGRALQAYVAAGVASDHESTTLAEAREKLAAGLYVMVREGSLARDLDALLPLLRAHPGERIGFVTDDRLPHDLRDEGAVDVLVRRAIGAGIDPVVAVRCASWNTARHFGLRRRGAIAPGYFADLLVIDDLAHFQVGRVMHQGVKVAEGGRLTPVAEMRLARAAERAQRRPVAPLLRASVKLPPLDAASFHLPAPPPGVAVRVLRPRAGELVSERLALLPTVVAGAVVADVGRDLLKLACIHRHGRVVPGIDRGIGLGLVHGLGLRVGAVASSVAHDHHNLMVAGADDAAMVRAAERVAALGGGFVLDDGVGVVAEVALPIAGLVSDALPDALIADLEALDRALRDQGAEGGAMLMTLSFLGLAVIPALRLTDRGLVEVASGSLVPLGLT